MSLLLNQLPSNSRIAKTNAPELEWSPEAYILWNLEFQFRQFVWALGNGKEKKIPKPEPLPTPQSLVLAREKRDAALAARGEINRILGIEVS